MFTDSDISSIRTPRTTSPSPNAALKPHIRMQDHFQNLPPIQWERHWELMLVLWKWLPCTLSPVIYVNSKIILPFDRWLIGCAGRLRVRSCASTFVLEIS